MREILFRAKTKMIVGTYNCGKEDGEWVIGCLYCDVGKWIIRQFEFDRADYVSYEVDPETVCQYTGLKDKSDKKVFEGDILNVIYSDKTGECHHAENYVLDDLRTTSVIGWLDYANELEIVGNKFDNPELI